MAEISLEHSRGLALVRRMPSNAPALDEFDTEKTRPEMRISKIRV